MFFTCSASNLLTELSSDDENKFVRSIRILEPTKLRFDCLNLNRAICLFANTKHYTYQYLLTVLSMPLCLYVSVSKQSSTSASLSVLSIVINLQPLFSGKDDVYIGLNI